jgi:hypothetical protein
MRQSGYWPHACRTATWARWRRDNERDGRDGGDPTLTKELSAEGRAICGCNLVAEMTGHGSGAWMLRARRSGWRCCRTEGGGGRAAKGNGEEERGVGQRGGLYGHYEGERSVQPRSGAAQGDWPRRGFREVLHRRVGVTDRLSWRGRTAWADCGRGRLGGLGWRETRCGTPGSWAHLLGRRQDGGQHEPKVLVRRAREAGVGGAGRCRRARRTAAAWERSCNQSARTGRNSVVDALARPPDAGTAMRSASAIPC